LAKPSTSPTKSTTRTRTSSKRGPASKKASTRPPTKKLSEAARHFVRPDGIETTAWTSVGETCRRLGATFDPWQEGAGRAILGKNSAGLFAADAVTLSIPRQVGKTYLVGWIVIGLCLTQPKTLAIWTAHHGATAADTFRDLKGICQQAKVAPFVRHIYDSGARLEIIFTNGSRIVFGAREHGFGRGFKRVGILIFDEAQILTAKAADDMVPTTNRHPNPLIFYMGTPPKPSDPSEHFLALRTEALAVQEARDRGEPGVTTETLYLEFSADPDADPNDREQWAKANPSYPHHTTPRAMLRMKKNLKGPNAFAREALGIWDGTANTGVFSASSWARCKTEEPEPPVLALGVAADIDQTWLSLGAFGRHADLRAHVGAVWRTRFDTGREAFVDEVARIARERNLPVGIGKRGPAAPLIPDLEERGVRVVGGGLDDFIQGCADIRDLVETQGAAHGAYPELDEAVDAATWKKVGDRRVFERKGADISMLEAATWAAWADFTQPAYDVLDSIG
jgi:hypothetical protein